MSPKLLTPVCIRQRKQKINNYEELETNCKTFSDLPDTGDWYHPFPCLTLWLLEEHMKRKWKMTFIACMPVTTAKHWTGLFCVLSHLTFSMALKIVITAAILQTSKLILRKWPHLWMTRRAGPRVSENLRKSWEAQHQRSPFSLHFSR